MNLVLDVKSKEQEIEHLKLKNKEISTDLHIEKRKIKNLEEEIDR